ncbi:Stage II sporulation protein E [compost metagenome]
MLEKLLKGGFNQDKSIEIINSILKLKSNENHFATLDTFVVNLKNAEAEFIKIGAAPTYVIDEGKVSTINTCNIPIGILQNTEYLPIVKKLNSNSIIVQVSDGVISDKMDVNNNYLYKYLQQIDSTRSARAIADDLYRVAVRENGTVLNDDATIIVSKLKIN